MKVVGSTILVIGARSSSLVRGRGANIVKNVGVYFITETSQRYSNKVIYKNEGKIGIVRCGSNNVAGYRITLVELITLEHGLDDL